MTKTETEITEQSNHNSTITKKITYKNPNHYSSIPIPSREEFHRYASNIITEKDFLCPGRSIPLTASALRWTIGHAVRIY